MKITLTVGDAVFVGDAANLDLDALSEVCLVENFTGTGGMGTVDAGMAYGVGANQQRRRLRLRKRRRVREGDESAVLQHSYAQQLRVKHRQVREEPAPDAPVVEESVPRLPIAKRLMREGTLFPKDARSDTTFGAPARTGAKVAIARQDTDKEKLSAMDTILGRPETKSVPTVPPITGSGKGQQPEVPPPTAVQADVPPVAEPTTPQPAPTESAPPGIPSPAEFALSESSAGTGGFSLSAPPPPPTTDPRKTLGGFRGFI
jgi:hypothetical protein